MITTVANLDTSSLERALAALRDDIRQNGFTRPLQQAAGVIARSIDLDFRQAGSRVRWAPNAPSTLKQKARKGQGNRPWIATGASRRALTATRPGAPESLFDLTPDRLTMGMEGPQAMNQRTRSRVPARPIGVFETGIVGDLQAQVQQGFAVDMKKRAERAGF